MLESWNVGKLECWNVTSKTVGKLGRKEIGKLESEAQKHWTKAGKPAHKT